MKKTGVLLSAVLAVLTAASLSLTSLAAPETAKLPFDPDSLAEADQADQLVAVAGTEGCQAQVYYLKRSQTGDWQLEWSEEAVIGRNGIRKDKREGDGCTPAGTYRFTMAFGLLDDPETILPYHKIQQGDYWVDDPESPYYNQLVNTAQVPVDWTSAENMAASYPAYHYGLVLSYNQECTPGLGSAIFLHCFTAAPDNGSAGCIRLPQERVKELLQSVTEHTRIVIAPSLEELNAGV